MTEEAKISRRSVAVAAGFLVLAVVAFAAAFFLFNGVDWVKPLMAIVAPQPAQSPAVKKPAPTRLVLPAGMTEEAALRLWQEQVDSQAMIEKLVGGEVASLKIDKVDKSGDEALLTVTVKMKDGSSAPGTIGMRQYAGKWYVAFAAGDRADDSAAKPGPGDTPLPSLSDVDIKLLSTMLAEQTKSQSVIEEYLAGIVKEVFIEDVKAGPQTATMNVEMDETHGDGYAKLVAIQSDNQGSPAWFLARFTKTGDATKTAQ